MLAREKYRFAWKANIPSDTARAMSQENVDTPRCLTRTCSAIASVVTGRASFGQGGIRVKKLGAMATILAAMATFGISAAPARDRSAHRGAVEVNVSGSSTNRLMIITGTVRSDRLRIDRKAGRGLYVINANRPVGGLGGPCEQVARQVVQCRLPDGRLTASGFFSTTAATVCGSRQETTPLWSSSLVRGPTA